MRSRRSPKPNTARGMQRFSEGLSKGSLRQKSCGLGKVGKGDILLFCLGSWASAGSQREYQAHAVRGGHPRETHPAARCRGSKRGSKSLRWKLVRFLA